MVDAYNQYMGYTTLPPSGAIVSAGAAVVAQTAQGRDLMDGRVATRCTTLLRGVASSGHSDTEVAAFCRAAYTPEMCGTLRTSLGKMPWSEAKVQDVCQQWDADVMTRGLMSYDELSESLEASANTKAQLGYNMPRNSDGTVNIDQSVQMKLAQTQSMVDAYNQYMGYTTLPPSGAVGSAGPAVAAQAAQGLAQGAAGAAQVADQVSESAVTVKGSAN